MKISFAKAIFFGFIAILIFSGCSKSSTKDDFIESPTQGDIQLEIGAFKFLVKQGEEIINSVIDGVNGLSIIIGNGNSIFYKLLIDNGTRLVVISRG